METYSGPVFKQMPKKSSIFGLGLKEWAYVILTGAIGALVAFSLSNITHIEVQELSLSERNNRIVTLQHERDALVVLAECQNDMNSLTSDAQAKALAGQEDGLTAGTTDEEIEQMVPTTKEIAVSTLPAVPRWMLCFLAPTLIVAGGSANIVHGSSIFGELSRVIRNERRQELYLSRPKEYIDSHIKG